MKNESWIERAFRGLQVASGFGIGLMYTRPPSIFELLLVMVMSLPPPKFSMLNLVEVAEFAPCIQGS